MSKKGLTREQLKLLAIIAMVVDHTAWGFVEFMSPLGQIMHIFGRFTMPIMCFFIAEGYRHTKNLRAYLSRMVSFALISIIPFYIFFHEEYGYRQNIIFDLLLALLALCAMEHKAFPKPLRLLLVGCLLVISILVGGWVVMPILYVLIFYYGKDFRTKARNFILVTVLMEVSLIVLILLNQRYHFSSYDWTVQERIYLVFFVIALIPLSFYNGEKGKPIGGRYFFYCFYPAHFLVLSFIGYVLRNFTWQGFYILIHVVALLIGLAILFYVITQPTSRAQMAVTFFMSAGVTYIYGFLLEITTSEVAGVFTATKVQYFAEALVMISITLCAQELCHTRIPTPVYIAEGVVCTFVLYSLFTYQENGLMYRGISINTTAGSFPRMEIEGYGIAFYLFVVSFFFVCLMCIGIGIHSARTGDSLQRKRLRYILFAMLSMWLPYFLKMTDFSNGYEIPALFIPVAAGFLTVALVRYSFLDSVSLNAFNAINQGGEGILVIDRNHRVLYHNDWIHDIFGQFHKYDDAYHLPDVKKAFTKEISKLEKNGATYELRVEPLMEQGHHTGNILWVFDMTKHYQYLNRVEENSTHDALTGLNNRMWYETTVKDLLTIQTPGAFFMVDLDNFKHVNDGYGHKIGDAVLSALSKAIRHTADDFPERKIISGRIGGDEFSIFFISETDKSVLSRFSEALMYSFANELKQIGHPGITSLSLGIAIVGTESEADYTTLFEQADMALYQAKEAGRNTFRFFA